MTSAITDFAQYNRMRLDVNADSPAVLREVAGQFEALFVETLLKNMRSSSLGDPIFGQSDQYEMYQGMLDQQLAVEMSSGRGIGIADMLVRQLGGEVADLPTPAAVNQWFPAIPAHRASRQPATTAAAGAVANWTSPADFARDLWPHAERVGQELDVAPEALLAQAALETGWGAHVMRRRDGRSSFNLFGIKAGRGWVGASVAKNTLEFKHGVAYRERARFRAYPDISATFDDYAAFIGGKARYASVRGSGQDTGHFASALQESGYATDPHYAGKIERIVNGDTMRDALQALKGEQRSSINQSTSPVSGQ